MRRPKVTCSGALFLMFVAAFLSGFTGLVMAEMTDIALDAPRTRSFLLQLATGNFLGIHADIPNRTSCAAIHKKTKC